MKIVIASGIYPPDIGGPATYSQLIAREFTKRGIEVSLICYSDKKQKDNEGFKIIRILRNNKLVRYFLYFFNLLKLAKNCDVVYAQGPLAAGLPAMWVCKILRKKFVIKIVGDYAWEQAVNQFEIKDLIDGFQNKKYNPQIEKIRKIQKKVVSSADSVIVPSEYLKKIVLGWGVNNEKVKVIYNVVPDLEQINKIEADKELESKGDVIISVGRLEPWKGMIELAELMPELRKENKNFYLKIVGEVIGSKSLVEQGLRKIMKPLEDENSGELTVKLPHEKLMSVFKASKIFVLNTGYEGFSHLILEAMACGLPVITTNVCGNPEIIKDGYNGLLVKYNNKNQIKEAILKLWRDKELQKKFIENGYKTLEKFSLEEMIENTIRVLGD